MDAIINKVYVISEKDAGKLYSINKHFKNTKLDPIKWSPSKNLSEKKILIRSGDKKTIINHPSHYHWAYFYSLCLLYGRQRIWGTLATSLSISW